MVFLMCAQIIQNQESGTSLVNEELYWKKIQKNIMQMFKKNKRSIGQIGKP